MLTVLHERELQRTHDEKVWLTRVDLSTSDL
jgi:hypothetical protein